MYTNVRPVSSVKTSAFLYPIFSYREMFITLLVQVLKLFCFVRAHRIYCVQKCLCKSHNRGERPNALRNAVGCDLIGAKQRNHAGKRHFNKLVHAVFHAVRQGNSHNFFSSPPSAQKTSFNLKQTEFCLEKQKNVTAAADNMREIKEG